MHTKKITPARTTTPLGILAIFFIAAIAFVSPASAIGYDDGSGTGIPVLRYDFTEKALVPVMGPIMLSPNSASVYNYEDGKYFILNKGADINGKIFIAYISYAPKIHFIEETDLQKTRDALKEYCQNNNLKADGAGTGAVTEKFRQCNEQLPNDRLTALLYPVESTV